MPSDTDSPKKDKKPGRGPSSKFSKKHKSQKSSSKHERTKLRKHRRPNVGISDFPKSDSALTRASARVSRHRERRGSKSEVGAASKAPSLSRTLSAEDEDAEKLDQARRLKAIVRDHIGDSDVIYDRPYKPSDLPSNRWMMSGALVTDPAHVQGLRGLYDDTTERIEVRGRLSSDGGFSGDRVESRDTGNKGGPGSKSHSKGRKHKNQTFTEGTLGGRLRGGGQGSSRSAPSSAFQSNDCAPFDGSAHEPERLSSSNPSVATSSPIFHTKRGQRLKSTKHPKPVRIAGPQHPKLYDRVMPRCPPAIPPATPDPVSPADKAGREGTERAELTSDSIDPSKWKHAKTPIPAPQP